MIAGVGAIFAQSTVAPVVLSNYQTPACVLEGGTSPALYSCNYSVTVTNNLEPSVPLTIWWGVCSSSTCVATVEQTANVVEGASMTFSTGAYPASILVNLPKGSYTLATFTTNKAGTPDSNTLTTSVCVPGPCSVSTTTTTTTVNPGIFMIFYPSGVTISQVLPAGASPFQGLCSNGMTCYTAVWTTGTKVTLTATFDPTALTLCWIYDTGLVSDCNASPVINNAPFTITTEAYPHYAILLSTANPTPTVTINPIADLSGGSWSSGSFTLSPGNPTSPGLSYKAPTGFTCSDSWFLQPIPTNPATESNWLQGSSAQELFTISYSKIQLLIASQGTTFNLMLGSSTQTTDPCTQQSYLLTFNPTNGVLCDFGTSTGAATNTCASENVLEGQTIYLYAFPTQGNTFSGWLLDGVKQPLSGSASLGYRLAVAMNEPHSVEGVAVASACSPNPCTTTTSSSSSPGSGIVNWIPWIMGPPGALLLILGIVLPKPRKGHLV